MQVSLGALIQRINRRLRKEDEVMKKSRSERVRLDLGDYYILDFNRNFIVAQYVDPEAFGREIGALESYETVIE